MKEGKMATESTNIKDCTVEKSLNTQKGAKLNSYFLKATALRREKAFKEACTNYLNAILIDRDNADSYYGLGICYKQIGRAHV